MRVGLARLGLARIRPVKHGLARPGPHTLCGLQTLACFFFYDKTFNV